MINIAHDRMEKLVKDGKVHFVSTVLEAQTLPVVAHWKTGDKPVNFLASITAGLKTTITLARGAVCSSDGTPDILYNKNGNFPDGNMSMKRFTAPTVTSPGVVVSTDQIGFGTNPGQSVSGSSTDTVSVLKKNTSYITTITPSAETDITIDILFWEDD